MNALPEGQQDYLNELPHMVWLDTGESRHFNQEWKEYFGDSYSHTWPTLIHHFDLHQFTLAGNSTCAWETTVRLRRHDGAWIWHRLMARPFENGWIGSAVNIHSLKKVEDGQRLLAESILFLSEEVDIEKRLRAVARLLVKRFGGWCTFQLSDGLHVSESSFALSESLAEDIQSLSGITTIKTGESVLKNFPSNKHGLCSFLSCPMKKDDKVFGVITITSAEETLTESDLEFAGEISRLISPFIEKARLVSELRKNEEILHEAIESRDIFLSICSHELKTPVQSLKLLSQISLRQLRRGTFPISEQNVTATFQKFSAQVDRLANLIEDMLDISRMESGNFVFRKDYFSLTKLMQDVLEKYEAHFSELSIPFTYEIEEEIVVNGDIVRIEQVIQNIINNAIKYGRLQPVHVTLKKAGTSAVIRVKDNGTGIPESFLDKIFHRFERVGQDSNITGLGLGLYICKTIVDSHQGVIQVKSEEDVGSTFSVYLPLKTKD